MGSNLDGINSARDSRQALAQTRRLVNSADEMRSALGEAKKDLGMVGDTQALKAAGSTSALGKGLPIAGVASSVAGFALAAKEGNVPRMVQNLADLGNNLKDVMKMVPTEKLEALMSKIPGGAELLKRVGGPAAIVAGISGAIATLQDAQKHGWSLEKGLKMASSVLTTVAGVAMMVPGGQPVAAAAGIAAAGLGVGALAVHYKDKIAGAAEGAAKWAGDEASAAGNAVSNGVNNLKNGAASVWKSVFGG
jgi:hypothetical protein